MQTRLLKPIDLTPAESASGQQLAHPDRDELANGRGTPIPSECNTAGRKGWQLREIEKEHES